MATISTLILTPDDTAAGCLAASGMADRVIGFSYRLVTGPVPAVSEPEAFFAERARLGGTEIQRWDTDGPDRLCDEWRDRIRVMSDFDRVEIWADHDPNSQLQLVQLLDWLSAYPSLIPKLLLRNPDFLIRSQIPESIPALRPRAEKISAIQLQTAKLALQAFQHPSPEAWFALLREDLQALPYLQPTVSQLLEELPATNTALTAAETKLLEIVSTGPIAPMRAIAGYRGDNPVSVLDYWELGTRLHGLARCETPAILGLDEDGPFNLALHDDCERFERYKRSRLSLSELGRTLLKQQADFAQHCTIDRWWGGTRLTNDRLWRWDNANRVLVPSA
ncbi:hypothetical protein CQ14_24825 [Bradyrhizobium lablabi]|uniref:DUF1835 domain-containing protein n=1 Tax=Bradyrhizobium lablabi TaxID=722472 RepID=A0A0R3MF76_9BRAD|nr:hypothetical protein [Bradyrhizobium lablabi]KRR18158.1 hypothetical protein CQ14_24825 [Bradyrhizobium lablabi]